MSPEEHAHWWLREESCAECECDKPFSPPSCICARDLTNMFRSAQSQARDEALDECASLVARMKGEISGFTVQRHMARAALGNALGEIHALKSSKP
jgi:hypothetical protein